MILHKHLKSELRSGKIELFEAQLQHLKFSQHEHRDFEFLAKQDGGAPQGNKLGGYPVALEFVKLFIVCFGFIDYYRF